MRYLSVCSGIEAATVAWHGLGWKPAAFSEIEKFPSQVLAHHYPDVPNVGDMTKYKEWDIGSIDLLVGGTPCQSFSVAGLRKGLEDPRGNLALVYCGILDHFRPKWFVWENVPGVLSSGGGRDFGSFLGALAELGYGFAYRVLDAQYFGVAQRRRRVFVVGHLGDWRRAAAVLFERESLRRDTAPSREKGEKTSRCLTTGSGKRYDAESETMIPTGVPEVMSTLLSSTAGISRPGNAATEHETYIPMAFQQNTRDEVRYINGDGLIVGALAASSGMKQTNYVHGVAQPIPLNSMNCFRSTEADPSTGCGVGDAGEAMFTITKTNHHAVAQPVAYSFDSLASNSMKSSNPHSGCRAVDLSKTLDTTTPEPSKNQGGIAVMQAMAVRRLTPVECERLQGFPDGYTDIQPNGKPTPDGPRYKALGNSMAVPVMRWIGERINDQV